MDKLDSDFHPHFFWLALWRGLIGLLALYVVLEKPLSAVVVSLAVLGCLLVVGEISYKYMAYLERQRLHEERQRELRQKRLEEAQLRYERMKEVRLRERRSLETLEDETEEAAFDDSSGDAQFAGPPRSGSKSASEGYSARL